MSFVSNSSTSGFKVPTNTIISHFADDNLIVDDLLEGGSVYTINADAFAPFDTVQGQTYTVIQSTPVLNGSFAYNGDTLSPEDVKAIQELFTSDEVFDTQAVFRLLLEAMANPARTVSIAAQQQKLFGTYPAFLALGMTLMDNEVTFSTCGDEQLKQDLQLVTLSQEVPVRRRIICLFRNSAGCLPFWCRQSAAH